MLRKQFEVKQIAESRVLELYLYGEICGDWYDWWNGQIVESTTSANYIRKAVDEAGEVDEIKVYINSCGGSVDRVQCGKCYRNGRRQSCHAEQHNHDDSQRYDEGIR